MNHAQPIKRRLDIIGNWDLKDKLEIFKQKKLKRVYLKS